MGDQTNISWCDATWSPWGTRDVRADSAWKEPLRWNRHPALLIGEACAATGEQPLVFPSMCDPFDNHPDLVEPRRRFFDLIRATPNLTWLLLTKRPGNIVKLLRELHPLPPSVGETSGRLDKLWPHNAAIGCTVVNQEEADRDIPKLLAAKVALIPAFAFVSMEPLLGPVDLEDIPVGPLKREDYVEFNALTGSGYYIENDDGDRGASPSEFPTLDWVIAGGETDQGKHRARDTPPDWFRSIRDQCLAAGVTYHHKQMTRSGPIPADLQIRERPFVPAVRP